MRGGLNKLLHKIRRWDACTLAHRLEMARVILLVHGYLRDSESQRIKERLHRDWLRAGAEDGKGAVSGFLGPSGAAKIRCQFCDYFGSGWKQQDEVCPKCGRQYDWLLAQDSEDAP